MPSEKRGYPRQYAMGGTTVDISDRVIGQAQRAHRNEAIGRVPQNEKVFNQQ